MIAADLTREAPPRRTARGHVVVRARALERVFTALAARALGVAPARVRVRIGDEKGALRVEVRAPFAAREQSVIDAGERVRDVVRHEGAALTGARISTVRVRIVDAPPPTIERVS